jgi:hypothetical protein
LETDIPTFIVVMPAPFSRPRASSITIDLDVLMLFSCSLMAQDPDSAEGTNADQAGLSFGNATSTCGRLLEH